MRDHTIRENVVNESELVTPMALVASTLGRSQEMLEDAGLLLRYLDEINPDRALYLLDQVHGLGYFLQLGGAELKALGLSEAECLRILGLPPMASRLLAVRSKWADPATRRDLADEIAYRGLQWDQVTAGVIAWDAQGRRVADRFLAVGTATGANLDLSQAIRITLCSGGASFLVWVWSPTTRLQATQSDRAFADLLRTMASALSLQVADVLLVAPGDAVSMAVVDQWVD